MDYGEFLDRAASDLGKELHARGFDVDVDRHKVEKLQGKSYEGLRVVRQGDMAGHVIDPKHYYQEIQNGCTYKSTIWEMADFSEEAMKAVPVWRADPALLASAGIFSMMIGFGAKDLVGEIVAGFFTIVEGTYKVGDFVTIGGWSGTVVEIGLRTTKVQAFADTKVFNNSAIREVINANGEVARMVLKAPISYEADLNKVEAILNEELPKMMDVIPGLVKPPAYEGVDKLGDNSVELCITIFVKTSSKMRAIRALTREIKLLFDREGIEIPYNQLVLHNAKEPEPVKDHD